MPKKSKKKQDIKERRISPRLIVGIAVGFFVAVALLLRICPVYDDIFVGNWVKFSSNDAYYYMRLVDNMVSNFPHMLTFDQYQIYPDGQGVLSYYLFARLLAFASWIIGLGHPSQHLVDVVCAYAPAIMGALVVVPVYFIGRELGSRWVGLISAVLIAIMPGEFLGRTMLGFADHHVAEVLFSTVSMMFLVMAIKIARERCVGLGSLRNRSVIKPIVYGVLAGFFLGVYGLTWQGGSLFLFVVSLYFVVQCILDHLKHRSILYLCVVGVVFNLVAMVVFLPSVVKASSMQFYMASMGVALLLPIALGGLSWLMSRMGLRVSFYPLAVFGIGIMGIGVFYAVSPSLLRDVANVLLFVFFPTRTQLTTIEMQPLLFPNGVFTFMVAWGNFGLALFVALVALIAVAYRSFKSNDACKALIVVWTIVILAMALGQRRFAYYLAVNVSLLAGYLSWKALDWAGLSEWQTAVLNVPKSKRKRLYLNREANVAFVAVLVVLLVFLPLIPSVVAARVAHYAPSNAWCESLDWLRESSPEPFVSDNQGELGSAYYRLSLDEKASYGVLAWWDYGYWITRIARRIPNVTPGQNLDAQTNVAAYLISQDEQLANGIIRGLGSKYVVIDLETVTGKFWAIARYAGKEHLEYFGIYYAANGNQLVPLQLFYPDYYRSLVVRLYNFDGKAVVPHNVIVMNYEQRADKMGNYFNLVTDAKQFASYGEAETFLSGQKFGNWRIVSNNPLVSPIYLDAVEHYELAYSSSGKKAVGNVGEISEVKIFRCVE